MWLKLTWLEGVGLAPHSKRHTKVKVLAEMQILMEEYQETELHSFWAGHIFDVDLFVDDFKLGFKKLGSGGKLKSWTSKTTQSQGLQTSETSFHEPSVPLEEDEDSSKSSDSEGSLCDIIENSANTFGIVHISEGDLMFSQVNVEAEAA